MRKASLNGDPLGSTLKAKGIAKSRPKDLGDGLAGGIAWKHRRDSILRTVGEAVGQGRYGVPDQYSDYLPFFMPKERIGTTVFNAFSSDSREGAQGAREQGIGNCSRRLSVFPPTFSTDLVMTSIKNLAQLGNVVVPWACVRAQQAGRPGQSAPPRRPPVEVSLR